MKKSWCERHPGVTVLIAGWLVFNAYRTGSRMFPGYDPFWTVVYLLAILFLMIWGLICKSRSYWWLFLVVPIPLAYFILKNKSPREVVLE